MRRTMTAALVFVALSLALRADEAPKGKSRAAEEYQALVDEYAERYHRAERTEDRIA